MAQIQLFSELGRMLPRPIWEALAFTGLGGKGKGRPAGAGRPQSSTAGRRAGVAGRNGWRGSAPVRAPRAKSLFFLSLRTADQQLLGDHRLGAADAGLDVGGDVGVGLEELADVVAALADALAGEGEPGAGLLD